MALKNVVTIYGVVMILLAVGGYFLPDQSSPTALIPAAFGLIVYAAYRLTSRTPGSKTGHYVVAALGLVGFAATVSSVPQLMTLLSGGEVARPAATIGRSVMALCSLGLAAMASLLAKR